MTQSSAKQAPLFDLTPTDEQRMTREAMQRFAESEMRPIARNSDENYELPAEFLQQAHELGITMLAVPEEFGGAGQDRSPISNVLIAEDLAKGDMGLALAVLSPLGVVNTLLDQGSEGQKAKYLPGFVGESFKPAAVAISEPRATFDVRDIQTQATKDGDGYVLNGVKSLVPLATSAELFIVIANLEGQGPQAFIVEAGTAGVTTESQRYLGVHAIQPGIVKLESVRVGADALLGEQEKTFDYNRLLDLSRLGLCAAACGTAQGLLEHVTEYANERVAFGEPISHRQAVAFMVANIAIELEAVRLLTWRAASRAEQGLEFHREAHLAYINASERMLEIGNNGVQILGGAGFIREYLEELWYRNLRGVAIVEGCFAI
ncbi:MAG: acyl-CoA dehydrogenase family protein [Pseudomonadota bacterium]|nr:acyl-CoA dehydrogenase family protein [Pseudomonadota bacterium]